MSNKSNNQGRAYEFVCLLTLSEEIGKFRLVNIVRKFPKPNTFRST